MRKKASWNTPAYDMERANDFTCCEQRYFNVIHFLIQF